MIRENVCWARMIEGGRCYAQESDTDGDRTYPVCSHPDSTAETCSVMANRENGHRAVERALGKCGYEISTVRSEVIWVS